MTPAAFSESGSLLSLDLGASEIVGIVSGGTSYTFTLTAGSWTGTNSGNVSGSGTKILTVSAAGLAAFNQVNITDSGAAAAINFNTSGANAYSDDFSITLDSNPGAISFNGATSFGNSKFTVTTDRNIVLNTSATLTTTGGNISLAANPNNSATANFVGIDVSSATIGTGSGSIMVNGHGGGATGDAGVRVQKGGEIGTGSLGEVNVNGRGGDTGGADYGVEVIDDGSLICSGGGDVYVTGTGRGSNAANCHGVFVTTSGQIFADGSGKVFVTGTGGASSGGTNYGVFLTSLGQITSAGGAISVNGNGGGSGASNTNHGVFINTANAITGTGDITVYANAGLGAAAVSLQFTSGSITTLGSGNITIFTNEFVIAAGSAVNAQTRTVQIATRTVNFPVNIGAADSSITLGLSTTELGLVTAGTLIVGDSGTGPITVSAALSSFAKNLSLITESSITINQPISMAAGISLSATADGTISLPAATDDLTALTTGSITLTTKRDISIVGATLITASGAIGLSANAAGSTTGNFDGVLLSGAILKSTSGAITVSGHGGTTGVSDNIGVSLTNKATIGGTSGPVTVTGVGGTATSDNYGVIVSGSGTSIGSGSGNVKVDGTGGTKGAANYGVLVDTSGLITAGGTGTVDVIGHGGATVDTSSNFGVYVHDGTTAISSAGGNVTITGYGGGSGFAGQNTGIKNVSCGFSAAGTGSITLMGTGGAGSGGSHFGIDLEGNVTTAGGAISVQGTGGTGAAGSNIGVQLGGTCTISTGGTGAINVLGTGGTGTNGFNDGVNVSGAITLNGPVSLTGSSDYSTNSFALDIAGGSISAGSSSCTLIGDSMNINVTLTAGTATVRQQTNATQINIGIGPTILLGTLGLADYELDLITAGTIKIGDANSGTVTIGEAISRAAATNMQFNSGSDIVFTTGSINTNGGTLLLATAATARVQPTTTGNDVKASTTSFGAGTDLGIAINGLTVDTQYRQLNVIGGINLTGVDLVLSGTYAPAVGDKFTIVDNDASDAVTGTFNGLAEGSTISFNGSIETITYKGGTGNDVVLTTTAKAPPTVTGVTFGDGTNQRSLVKQIVVNFSEAVNFMGGVASAFTLHRTGTDTIGTPTGNVTLTANPINGPASSVTITFSGSLTEFGSLKDGLYDFTIDAAQVSGANGALDGNNDGTPGGSYFVHGTTTNRFFRFFGDSDGSGSVDQAVDFVAFKNAFGFSSSIFDFDNSGTVDQAADFVKFKNNFGLSP